jgi:hypothetical protein
MFRTVNYFTVAMRSPSYAETCRKSVMYCWTIVFVLLCTCWNKYCKLFVTNAKAETRGANLLFFTHVWIYKTKESVGVRTLFVLTSFESRNLLSVPDNYKRNQKLLQDKNCASRVVGVPGLFKHYFARNELLACVTETLYQRGLCLP